MSGILRNTLRLVGTAKYAPNNSTKYLRSMTLTTSRINNAWSLLQPINLNHKFERSQFTQANQKSTNFWTLIRAAKKKILAIFGQEIRTSNISDFEVSLGSNKTALFAQEKEKKCIFPSIFRIELNGKSIEPKSNITVDEKQIAFNIGKWWSASLAGDSLVLQLSSRNKFFILKHKVDVKAHISPPKIAKNGGVHTPRKLDFDIAISPVKITSNSTESGFEERSFPPVDIKSIESKKDSPQISTNDDNSSGKIKLHFPMSVSLENQQIIKIKDNDDTFTVYHTVDIDAYEENLPEFFSNNKKYITSQIDILEIAFESGDLLIQPKYFRNGSIMLKQEVYIKIDVDSEIPSILVSPRLKKFHDPEIN